MLRAMLDSSTPAATEPHSPPTPQRRPPGKPWVGGQSGNPSGRRAKPVDVGALCRKHTRAAIRALVRALSGSDPQAAVSAARSLLEHGHGAALQQIALHVPRISVLCHANDPEGDRANGEDTKASRAWDA